MASSSPKMFLKLVVDTESCRVILAEAPKQFVDFLFHMFSLPLGTLIEFLGSDHMVGCLGKLKDSLQAFPEKNLQPGFKMEEIFPHKSTFNGHTFLLSYNDASEGASKAAVKRCKGAGYVKEDETYVVLDDLVIMQLSPVSGLMLPGKLGVKDLSQLETKIVYFGKEEALKLLKASLETDKVLTTIFLH